jgi:hypothetical protein
MGPAYHLSPDPPTPPSSRSNSRVSTSSAVSNRRPSNAVGTRGAGSAPSAFTPTRSEPSESRHAMLRRNGAVRSCATSSAGKACPTPSFVTPALPAPCKLAQEPRPRPNLFRPAQRVSSERSSRIPPGACGGSASRSRTTSPSPYFEVGYRVVINGIEIDLSNAKVAWTFQCSI